MISTSQYVTLTRFYRMWHAYTAALRAVETDSKRRFRDLRDRYNERDAAMAIQFDHIIQALGAIEGTVGDVLSLVKDQSAQLTAVTDRLTRVTSGQTTPEAAAAEQAAEQAQVDDLTARLEALGQHLHDAIDGAKTAPVTVPQSPAPAQSPAPGIPDAPTTPVAPAGGVTGPDAPVATPTPGSPVTGLGGVSVDGQVAPPAPADGTVTAAPIVNPAPPVLDAPAPAPAADPTQTVPAPAPAVDAPAPASAVPAAAPAA